MEERLSLTRAIAWIIVSTLLISGSATGAWAYLQYLYNVRRVDPAYHITTLVQTGPEIEGLTSGYLAELLQLSSDNPTNLYDFDIDAARERLLRGPMIKEATVRTFDPGTIYVDYTIRRPIAYVGDYSNTAIDEHGFLFPCEPYYTPKKLPEFYLGMPKTLTAEDLWGQSIPGETFPMAMALLNTASRILGTTNTRIAKIDASHAFADSYGQRQIVLVIEETATFHNRNRAVLVYLPRVLRLRTTNFEEALQDYLVLRDHLLNQVQEQSIPYDQPMVRLSPTIVDLRLPSLAYLQSE